MCERRKKIYLGKIILGTLLVLMLFVFNSPAADAAEISVSDSDMKIESGRIYSVSNITELENFAKIVSGGQNCAGAVFVLTEDLVLNQGIFTVDEEFKPLYNGTEVSDTNMPAEWIPIGATGETFDVKFEGTFDGQGHTISGIYVYRTETHQNAGLFGDVKGTIRNLNISNSYIRGYTAGSVCSGMTEGVIENCHNSGYVFGSQICGGITGILQNSDMRECHNEGDFRGSQHVGGLAGCAYFASEIRDSWNCGNAVIASNYVGGIVGRGDGDINSPLLIQDCYNQGSLNGFLNVGGIVGAGTCFEIRECFNTGNIEAARVSGGITGGTWSASKNNITIEDCYNLGTVHCSEFAAAGISGQVGSYSIILNCYNAGTVSAEEYGTAGIVYSFNSRSCAVDNCYFLNTIEKGENEAFFSGIKSAKMERFANGQITELLNGKRTGEWRVWKQNLDAPGAAKQEYPGFTGADVYYLSESDIYTNNHVHELEGMWTADADRHEFKCTCNQYSLSGRHRFFSWVTVTEPTKATEGLRERACADCGYKAYETIPVIEDNKDEKIIKGIQNTTITAASKAVNGGIQISWKKSKGYKVDSYQIFRSVKRNSGYGTKPIYTTKSGNASVYKNTKSLKAGTRYYYKVRGVRTVNGRKYYTEWSNKVYRIAPNKK